MFSHEVAHECPFLALDQSMIQYRSSFFVRLHLFKGGDAGRKRSS